MANKDLTASPKLIELSKWEHADEVNLKLDRGESPKEVCRWINENGFSISAPMVYDYAKLRHKAIVDGISMEKAFSVQRMPVITVSNDAEVKTVVSKLRSEIDALDLVIMRGYETLKEFADAPVNPKLMMDAIKLKNDLTDGHHGYLTQYGMQELRKIENEKFQILIEHLLTYIPDNLKQEAVDKMAILEDEFYQTTPYYEEYLRADPTLTEQEIEFKLANAKNKTN